MGYLPRNGPICDAVAPQENALLRACRADHLDGLADAAELQLIVLTPSAQIGSVL